MSDNKNDIDKNNDEKIDVSEPYVLEYWKKRLGITTEQLKDVIEKVGPKTKDIEAFFAKQ